MDDAFAPPEQSRAAFPLALAVWAVLQSIAFGVLSTLLAVARLGQEAHLGPMGQPEAAGYLLGTLFCPFFGGLCVPATAALAVGLASRAARVRTGLLVYCIFGAAMCGLMLLSALAGVIRGA